MRKEIFCLVFLLLFFTTNAPAQQAPAAQVTVIRAGKLIGRGGGPRANKPDDPGAWRQN